MNSASSTHPLVRLDYVVRLLACPMSAMLVFSARVDAMTPKWVWSAVVVYALLWPHVARFIAVRSADSRATELRLLIVDAMLGGVWIPLTSFRTIPLLAFVIGYSTMLASVGGFRLFATGMTAMVTCGFLIGAITGFQIEPSSSYLTAILAGSMLFAFQMTLAVQTYRQARGFVQSRRRIADQAEQIRLQNDALVQAREEALQAAQAKATFLATMSHEIRTPMNGVLGMTRLLAETRLTPDQRDLVRTIQLSGTALLAIINDILDYSKIESGRMDVEYEPMQIAEAVEESLEIVAERAREKGIELVYRIASDVPPTIVGDITRLRQVLTNLIGNAVKFTEKGEVYVEVRLVRPEEGEQPAVISFEVRDSGIGIAPERISMLFSAFSQVDASITRRYGGTGLGLAISKRLTELMGGTITARSTPGQGSTFSFTIQTRAAETPDVHQLALASVPLTGRRVLVVDDNSTNRRVLSEQLSAWGLVPESVEGAGAALAALDAGHFDAAVLDLHMPDVDGVTLARRIRQRPEARDLPLVLLSSSVLQSSDDPEGLFAARLTKPARQSKLFDALMVAFSARRVEASPERETRVVPQISDTASLRILVADDNDVNRKLAGLILRRFGFEAEFATNGQEALDRVLHAAFSHSEPPFDMVLMDVHMPEMDGLEATRAIRLQAAERPDRHWPAIIAVTADAMREDRDVCLDAGMDDYLTKPLDFEAVQTVLERAAEKKKGASIRLPVAAASAVTPVVESSSSLIDWSRLDELREYDTPEGTVVKAAITSFVSEVPERLALMRTSIAQGDDRILRESAHRIKGAASNIGASRVADAAATLERAAKTGSLEGTGEMLDTLTAALDATVAELHGRYLSEAQ